MTSIPLNSANHVLESESRDKVSPLAQLEQQLDLDDIWRESWSDEEDEGTKKQKRQLKAVRSTAWACITLPSCDMTKLLVNVTKWSVHDANICVEIAV